MYWGWVLWGESWLDKYRLLILTCLGHSVVAKCISRLILCQDSLYLSHKYFGVLAKIFRLNFCQFLFNVYLLRIYTVYADLF